MVVIVRVELWPAVREAGVNETLAPAGAPVALNVTVWALPLVTFVLSELVIDCPAVAVTETGDAVIAKSLVGATETGLKKATPADQYIALAKLPENPCGAAVGSVAKPVTTVTVGMTLVTC